MPDVTVSITGALALLAGAASLSSQGQPSTPQFRTEIDLVRLEVSVIDEAGRPVRGLPRTAFTLTDDGKTQPIAAFHAVDVPPPVPPTAAGLSRDASSDVYSNETDSAGEGRLFVLLLDDALLPAEPATLQNAKRIARSVVDRLSPVDRMAVVFTSAGAGAQDFTSDRRKLTTAIESLRVGSAAHTLGWETAIPVNTLRPDAPLVPATDPDIPLRLAALKTLEMVADSLMAVPQRRRAVFLVSPGITVDFASDAQPVRTNSAGSGIAVREANRQLVRDTSDLLRRMGDANVTVYSIDPSGLGGLESYVADTARRITSLRNATTLPAFYNWLAPESPPPPADLARHVATLDREFLQTAAERTGGRALVNTNAFDEGLDRIFEGNASYYLLGYAEPKGRAAGSVHRVLVKVDRPGVTVRHRTRYTSRAAASPASESAETALTSALTTALDGPVSAPGLPMEATLAPVAIAGRAEAAVTIVLGLRQPPVSERTRQVIDFATAVFTPDGRRLQPPIRQTLTFTIVPGGGDLLRYEVLTHVAVAPGRYEIRLAAHRATDGLTGSVYAGIDVPAFAETPLSLSGVWFETSPGPIALPRAGLAALLPVVPTSRREFARTDSATTFLRIYQGGNAPLAPVSLTTRIVDDRDAAISSAGATIEAAQFDTASRAADHRFSLPVGQLQPGRYLLSFEVRLGSIQERRDVVFTVR